MSFNAIRENKILAKISESTVSDWDHVYLHEKMNTVESLSNTPCDKMESQFSLKHGHVVAPNFYFHIFYKGIIGR